MFHEQIVNKEYAKSYPASKEESVNNVSYGSVCLSDSGVFFVRGEGTHCGYPKVHFLSENDTLITRWALGKCTVIYKSTNSFKKALITLFDDVESFSVQYHKEHHTVELKIEELENGTVMTSMIEKYGSDVVLFRNNRGIVCEKYTNKVCAVGDTTKSYNDNFEVLAVHSMGIWSM